MLWPDFESLDPTSLLWTTSSAGAFTGDDSRDRLVRAAVAEALSPKQREVVEAYFFEGLSQGEIAAKLGISQQVVHKRLHGDVRGGRRVGGALRRLRDALAPHFLP